MDLIALFGFLFLTIALITLVILVRYFKSINSEEKTKNPVILPLIFKKTKIKARGNWWSLVVKKFKNR